MTDLNYKSVHPTYKKCIHLTYSWLSSDLQKVYIRPSKSVHPTYKSVHTSYKKCIHLTYNWWPSDLQKVYIRPTKSVITTYKKVNILTTKSVHPTYKKGTSDIQLMPRSIYKKCTSDLQKCTSDLQKCTSDLQKVYIRPTKSVHLTYKKCTSDLQKEGIYRCLLNQLAPCTWLELTTACTGRIKEKKCVTELYSCWPTLSPLRCQP